MLILYISKSSCFIPKHQLSVFPHGKFVTMYTFGKDGYELPSRPVYINSNPLTHHDLHDIR